MNTLQKLLKNKAEIEAELEKERQAKFAEEQKKEHEILVKEAQARQYELDEMVSGQVKEHYEIIKSTLGENVDPITVISAVLYISRGSIDTREFYQVLESVKRVMDNAKS